MKQPNLNQLPIQSLVNRLEVYLVTQNYTVDTLRHYRHVWRQLACYADGKGIVTADTEWIAQFLHEHYGISDGKPITRTQKTYYRAAGMLCDFQRYGYVLRRNHTKREIFPQRYRCIFEAAEKYCSQNRISERTRRQFSVLQAGVNLIYIRDWLGHASVKTTEIYARADHKMKRAALQKAASAVMPQYDRQSSWSEDVELMKWLNSLGK